MHKLVLVRHGDYDYIDGQYILNDLGRQEMTILAPKLKQLVAGQRVALHTSSAPRASASAAILAETLGVVVEEHYSLWSGNDGQGCDPNIDSVLSKIEEWQETCDVLVLVTHMEFVDRLPTRFASRVFQKNFRPLRRIQKGRACVIDCVSNTMYPLHASQPT